MGGAQKDSESPKNEPSKQSSSAEADTKPIKPHRPLNRVPRACNACRKQKMRCEGADDPPCKRCRNNGMDCLFEKPVRDTTNSEQGLERIRSLETQVTSIQNTLTDLVSAIRSQPIQRSEPSPVPHHSGPSPRFAPYPPQNHSPSGSSASPALPSPHYGPRPYEGNVSAERDYPSHGVIPPSGRHPLPQRHPSGHSENGSSSSPQGMPMQYSPQQHYGGPQPPYPGQSHIPPHHMAPPPSLPPFSSLQGNHHLPPPHFANQNGMFSGPQTQMAPRQSPSSHPPRPYGVTGPPSSGSQPPGSHYPPYPASPATSNHPRPLDHLRHLPASNVTSADSSDDEGELPTSGLVAPISVLRGLADIAAERADTGDYSGSGEHTRSPSPERKDRRQGGRASKRRKTAHPPESISPQAHVFPDVVTKEIITERDARDLFAIFYHGCSTFLPVFDAQVDTYDALHKRSPFCVNVICMVAAKVRDGGGPESSVHKRCMEEVHAISCATLFSPVTRQEAVQAMIIVAGWSSDGGWLCLGHAVRMAFEIGMHKTWPRLLKRIKAGKTRTDQDERELVISTRTWFCLYLFEHQLSFGTGRPAVLHEDESVLEAREFLKHPLMIEDDLRLISMVELAIIRERVHNKLSQVEVYQSPEVYAILRDTNNDFEQWYNDWDTEFSKHYEDVTFSRQSLEVQRHFAELFHNATALRGVRGHDDVAQMPPEQRALAMRSINIAKAGLDICVRSASYRTGLKYAVHFTHVSATFAASFLIRLARLFPKDVDLRAIMIDVEDLATILSQIPATRYARTLRLMLQRARKRRVLPSRSLPSGTDPSHERTVLTVAPATSHIRSPTNPDPTTSPTVSMTSQPQHSPSSYNGSHNSAEQVIVRDGFENIPPGYDAVPDQELPLWLSESNLGDIALSQFGLEAFLIPQQFDEGRAQPEIW